jgi:hypothetical protein
MAFRQVDCVYYKTLTVWPQHRLPDAMGPIAWYGSAIFAPVS